MEIAPGAVVAGKYLLEREIVRPGRRLARDRGSVWVARKGQRGSRVAIKLLSPVELGAAASFARFEREARAAAALASRHVVRVWEHGVADGVPFVTMELLAGEDLAARLLRRGALPLREALCLLEQIGDALARAHQADLVHRSLRPESIFFALEPQGEMAKLLDFAVAREDAVLLFGEPGADATAGSLHCVSPEQIRAERVLDARTDVWSLGAILFRTITGRDPFPGDVPSVVVSKILLAPIPSAAQLVPGLPPELDSFFERALARDRGRRFRSVRELVDEFARIAARAPSEEPVAALAVGGAAAYATAPCAREIGKGGPDTLLDATSPDLSELRGAAWRTQFISVGAVVVLGVTLVITAVRLQPRIAELPALQPASSWLDAAPARISAVPPRAARDLSPEARFPISAAPRSLRAPEPPSPRPVPTAGPHARPAPAARPDVPRRGASAFRH